MPRVVHFEISADDPERAATFYRDVFGWEVRRWEGVDEDYSLVFTGEGPGIDGGLFRRNEVVGHVNIVDVPDLDAFLEKVEAAGGTVMIPKMAIPGIGWLAYIRDTERSVVGLMQNDSSAK